MTSKSIAYTYETIVNGVDNQHLAYTRLTKDSDQSQTKFKAKKLTFAGPGTKVVPTGDVSDESHYPPIQQRKNVHRFVRLEYSLVVSNHTLQENRPT